MKRALSVAGAVGALLLVAAAAQPTAASPVAAPDGKLVLTVKEGANWLHSFRVALVVKVTARPQMAFWLEDTDGKFVATVYVTHKAATEDWQTFPGASKYGTSREAALPVWSYKHREIGIMPMATCAACHAKRKATDRSTANTPMLDAITSATPETGFTREWTVPESIMPGTYVLRAEINHARDWNETYRADAREVDSGWSGGDAVGSGQPSLVWQGTIQIGGAASEAALKPVGHGHSSGATGDVIPDLKTLTTAMHIVEAVQVKYVPW
jgi:hypothetical protein